MRRFGPGLLVMAAFIGPGTVATASSAGANFGFVLLWALLFSVVATMVLQEMAARLGLVTGQGLSVALRSTFQNKFFNRLAIVLVVAAIGFGNAAYESGNISGAALALDAVTPMGRSFWAIIVAATAFTFLAVGKYKVIERFLIVLVVVMSTVFIVTMLMVKPDLAAMFAGLTTPALPEGSTLTVMALIGTTVVPYNLFLHSSTVREKWPSTVPLDQALAEARVDSYVSIGFGGLITLAIVATAAAAFFGGDKVFSASTMSQELEPLLGSWANSFFAVGLLAAGLTSAIASPLAAAYAVSGALGWPMDMSDKRFKAIWAAVLIVGGIVASIGTKPLAAIMFAQAANGFLLPIVAVFLLIIMNRSDLLGNYRNRLAANVLGVLVVLVVIGLSVFRLARVMGF